MSRSWTERFKAELFEGAPEHSFLGLDVLVVIPDLTRGLPLGSLLPVLLNHLHIARRVRVLIGLGLHRRLLSDELRPLLAIAEQFGAELEQHDPERLVSPSESRVSFHPWVHQSEQVFCVGLVEPHQYAGFSGGVKAVAIGCASRTHINAMHGVELLRDESTRLGKLRRNAFREALREAVSPHLHKMKGVQFVRVGGEWKVFVGPIIEAYEQAASVAHSNSFVSCPRPFDWLHLPVPREKAQNVYQASRAATYVALAERTAIRDGGWLLVEASCSEGMGLGLGEVEFAKALRRGREELLRELRGDKETAGLGGAQRAYVLVMALERVRVAWIGLGVQRLLESIGIPCFQSLKEATKELGLTGYGQTWPNIFKQIPHLEYSHQE